MPCMMKLHTHLIARVDDISNLETMDIRNHPNFPDTCLQTKVSWSKNVMDERECPPQILIGAQDTDFCTLIALAAELESKLTANTQGKFLFGAPDRDDDDEPGRINEKYTRNLREIWSNNVEIKR